MAKWKRIAVLVILAIVAAVLAMFLPMAPLYQPIFAVLFFVILARAFKVGSYGATLLFALALSAFPIVLFSVGAAMSSEVHLYEALYWSIISIAGLPGLIAFFLMPIALALATYAGRRWLYP